MALIPAGSFTMGDTHDGMYYALPLHSVYVSAFYMDQFEVTKALWDDVYQWAITNGYSFNNAGSGTADNHPVRTVNWYDVVKWCNARSEKEGKTPAYYTDATQTVPYRINTNDLQESFVKWNSGYRLPTEAEWEKAARGGVSGQRYPWGDTITYDQANYSGNPNCGGVCPVGSFAANGYGLYDMTANAWEWCWDWYSAAYYSSSPATDPRGAEQSEFRAVRGGSYFDGTFSCRTAYRGGIYATTSFPYLPVFGFRSVLPPGQ